MYVAINFFPKGGSHSNPMDQGLSWQSRQDVAKIKLENVVSALGDNVSPSLTEDVAKILLINWSLLAAGWTIRTRWSNVGRTVLRGRWSNTLFVVNIAMQICLPPTSNLWHISGYKKIYNANCDMYMTLPLKSAVKCASVYDIDSIQ